MCNLYSHNGPSKIMCIILGCILLSCATVQISGNHSQNRLIYTLMRDSKPGRTNAEGCEYAVQNDKSYSDFWFLPAAQQVTADDVWKHFKFMALGGYPAIWKYTYSDSGFSCYLHCPGSSTSQTYPVTSGGLRLYVSSFEQRSLKINRVYMVENDVVTTVTRGCGNCGLIWKQEDGLNTFCLSFSPNRSNSLRFWQLQFYYTHDSSYEERKRDIERVTGEAWPKRKWVIACLNFLQLSNDPLMVESLDSLTQVYETRIQSAYGR